jgi:cytochrome c2
MIGDPPTGRCGERHPLRSHAARTALTYLVAAAAFALVTTASSGIARADDGATIFQSKCSACHTIGKGKTVGPDLKGITTTEDPTWLKNWVTSPSAMVKSGDAKATALVKQYPLQMPDLGLSSTDVDAVVGYIAQQSGSAKTNANGPLAPVPKLPAGDSANGREYFVGGLRFKNGGPPCMSCHSISGIGALGGGTLGPDLTSAYQKYGGDAGLASFLTNVPTPTMQAVWSREPLLPQEIADITAFIKEGAVAERPLSAIVKLALIAAIVLVLLIIIASIYWRGRLLGVRKPLVQRANLLSSRKYARRS